MRLVIHPFLFLPSCPNSLPNLKIATGAKEQEDELESFMQGLSADMEKKELRKKEDLLRDLTQEIARVERLIEVYALCSLSLCSWP